MTVSSLPLLPLLAFALAPPAYASFSDVPASHPNREAIEYVQSQGIAEGYADGTFRPDQTIIRAEFMKIVAEAWVAADPDTGQARGISPCFLHETMDTFLKRVGMSNVRDVDFNAWYGIYVCHALGSGIINGYPDGTIRPEQTINLVEAAKIIVNSFQLPSRFENITDTVTKFPWFAYHVSALGEHKAIPLSITAFDQLITRGEMAEIIFRLNAGVTTKPSRTYDEMAGLPPVSDWKTYVNTNQQLQFEYPSTYGILTDAKRLTYPDGKNWHRIELQDLTAPERPYLIVEVNADGYGPFFSDVTYRLAEESDGGIRIVTRELTEKHENNNDGIRLIIPQSIESRNGNAYSMRFSYKEGGGDLEEVFKQVLESMRLLPASPNTPSQDMMYRNAQYGFSLRLPAASVRRSEEEVFNLPFAQGTTLSEKFLRIAEGANETSDVCYEPRFRVTSSANVTINGIRYRKETGNDSGMNQLWDSVRFTTLYPSYSGSTCRSFTFTLHSARQDVFENPPPLFDAAGESAVFDEIMQTVRFE